jgi:hypothetical protein
MGLSELLDSFAAKSPAAEAEAASRIPRRRTRARKGLRRLARSWQDPFVFPMLVFVVLVAIMYLLVGHQ